MRTPRSMKPFTYEALPVRVVFGVGSLAFIPAEVEALDLKRVLIIAGGSAETLGRQVARLLDGRIVDTFAEVRQHVPERLAADARRAATRSGVDGVIAVGGGSAIGLAKAVAIDADVQIVAVPTTYSGSEMTPIYGITGERKQTGRDQRALPKVVVYDPALTTDLPARVTASSGFNALAHCVEALYAPGTSPPVALVAEEGIRIIGSALPLAVREPDDIEARTLVLFGAYLAGSALAAAGTALHHKLCHVLGGMFGLVHADVHAVLLPHVVAFNQPAVPDEMDRVARALGAADAASALHSLATETRVPMSLADIGMPEDGLDAAAEHGVVDAAAGNPRSVDAATLRALLEDAYRGRPPARQHENRKQPRMSRGGQVEGREKLVSEWNAMTYEAKDNILRTVRREAEGMFAMAEQPEAWERPTACPGWEVRDIVAHLVDTTESYFVAFDAARSQGEVPEAYGLPGMGKRVNKQAMSLRTVSQEELLDRLRVDFDKMMGIEEALTAEEWTDLLVPHFYMGPLPAFFYPAFQLMDYGVHSWDIRQGLGRAHGLAGDAADLLVPFMMVLWQYTAGGAADVEPFEVGVRVTSGPNAADYRVRIAPEGFTYEMGDIESLPVVLEFDPTSMVLTTFGRVNAGTYRGDGELAGRFLNLFFRI